MSAYVHIGPRPREPMDLRDPGRPDDPLFNWPLVRGVITPDGGVVELRRPGSDVVERHEVRLNKREEEPRAMVTTEMDKNTVTTAADVAASAAETKSGGPAISARMRAIIQLYNAGKSYGQIARELGVAEATIGYYLGKASQLGLVQLRRQAASGARADASEATRELERRINELETRVKALEETKGAAPGIAVLEDVSHELETVRKELGIIVSGLAEVTKRVQALEEQRPAGGSDMTRELLRLLELALTGERRRIA